ncbi:N-acyl-D-amino-acid deacylase [Sphingopyxis panaciterrae]|uniref:N-acyl-D-amino-acid deacylase family protein n=1 Tax=Sphingopyxis panaciterrae TaxID=363841 RepID=UPI0014206E49|nr:D-aminoacylase [Sphingopyxis panaciterrae]NIJ38468.1 N-acyl-D-amino-acid deacylase [Sphingopyxis panaciterrae]
MRWTTLFALGLAVSTATNCYASTLIRSATIVNGRDIETTSGDVRIDGDRIVAVGTLTPRKGEVVVDGRGLVLAPGFIDTHSHHDEKLGKHLDATQLLAQGVTTIVVGQDGGSTFPVAKLFAERQAHPAAVNIASYSGHGTLRGEVLGPDYKREATPAEIDRMRALLDADMRAGALGLSTGLEYDPAIYSSHAEVIALASEAAKFGGRYISHMRSEDRELWAALDELIAIGRETHMPVQVSHAKLGMTDWWGQADRFLAKLDAARAEGIDASLDIYPYPYWQTTLTVLWPERDFDNRATAEFVLKHLAPPEGLLISADDGDASHVGKTVAQIATERGSDPVTTVISLIQAARAKGGDISVIGTSMDERDIAKLIRWSNANISSDGTFEDLHPRGAGPFAKILRMYVREKKLLPLGEAVRKMSSLSASHMGIADRGEIRVGASADLILFDPDTIRDNATTDHPTAIATGMRRVWVNGVLCFVDGKATGKRPGRVLRRGKSTPWTAPDGRPD